MCLRLAVTGFEDDVAPDPMQYAVYRPEAGRGAGHLDHDRAGLTAPDWSRCVKGTCVAGRTPLPEVTSRDLAPSGAVHGWAVLESDVHPVVMVRIRSRLREVLHRIEGDRVLVPDDEETRPVLALMDLLLDSHTRILHYADPERARPYKPLERDLIYLTIRNVLQRHPGGRDTPAFYADLLHSIVWEQPLPNTNHRSTLHLVNRLLFHRQLAPPSAQSLRAVMEAFIEASKPLIQEKEFAPDPGPLQQKHLASAQQYVAAVSRQAGQ